MSVLVKNLNGTSDNVPYGYDSWIDFWSKKKNVKPTWCRRCRKDTTELDGAHVQKVYGTNEWYIVPLCRSCNLTEGTFYVSESDLVPVR